MSRALHTLSTFGFGAAAGVGLFVLRPWAVAVPLAVVMLLLCATLQRLREHDVAGEARAIDGRRG